MEQHYKLDKIRDLADNDQEFIATLAMTFLEEVPEDAAQLKIHVENKNYLPFPTAMGRRDMRPAPAIVVFDAPGTTLLSGKKRTPVQSLKGYSNRKITWLVQTDKSINAKIELTSANAWGDHKQIKIGGAK